MTDRVHRFYKYAHKIMGLTVQDDPKLAGLSEAIIIHALQAGYHCLEQQQRAEAERDAQMAEVVD